ncbi:uncharacterized protein LOC127256856 isoform X1 [Andrographis paniculata]|uniref:uncharacterized protein LOC127256856 isoform X1 n=1 Tax=Andrographis paniculata TaxID=175694 RepID=UPI0021E954EE|nr:uncharacterized protein LOC127256856 isoform X1 [Andrographis paniculata]
MAATIGWYGPLIDLCRASSHIGDYVQLLVFVHRSTPVQYKIFKNGGEVVRMDIMVGDETRSYFPVTIWEKQMSTQVLAGHVFLLQNLKISRFGDVVEARALHCSSFQCLLHPNDFVSSKGLDDSIGKCRLGTAAREKLQKVVGWLNRARLAHCGSVLNYYEHMSQVQVNWRMPEEILTQDCSSLSDVSECRNSCKATFHASIGEIFLPITWTNLREAENERMFISRRLHMQGGNSLIDDFITTGCRICGTPVNAGLGSSMEKNSIPLYCEKSSNRLHAVGSIYRPFLLYVWDDMKYVPVLVDNNAAEVLFGNVSAEKVYSSYKIQKNHGPLSSIDGKNLGIMDKRRGSSEPNYYIIWLILLKLLFKHGKNSPLKFKVWVDARRDWECGRLQMLSVSFPAFRRIA